MPHRVDTPPRVDSSKHQLYHRNHGHLTEECKTLKDKIEDLIKNSCLKDFFFTKNHLPNARVLSTKTTIKVATQAKTSREEKTDQEVVLRKEERRKMINLEE